MAFVSARRVTQHVGWAKERSDVPIICYPAMNDGYAALCPSYELMACDAVAVHSVRVMVLAEIKNNIATVTQCLPVAPVVVPEDS